MCHFREAIRERLKRERFDVLVIGGGATGGGVALDAAHRGLKVALIERYDFGSGTSSKSTKLAHGGIRYLEKAFLGLDFRQFHLVREALREREILFQIAPHLLKALEIIIPIYRWGELPYYFSGLKIYDWVAGKSSLPKSRVVSPSYIQQKIPRIQQKGLVCGISYFDGQFNDARLNLEIILTAASLGATVLNYAELLQFDYEKGKMVGASALDSISGERFKIKANAVVNAAGPYVDPIRRMDNPKAESLIAPSSGTHILLDQTEELCHAGLLVPQTKDGRVIFILPWEGSLLVGTTDNPTPLTNEPKPNQEEIKYLLDYARQYLHEPLAVKAAWTGIRPLVSRSSENTEKIVRDHLIEKSPSGLITIAGGKWTTFRKMAEDTVDHITKKPSSTADIRLSPLKEKFCLSEKRADHLSFSHGMLQAEVAWALKEEMAMKPMDILRRRTSLAALDTEAAKKALPQVISMMQKHFNWTCDQAAKEEQEALGEL